MKPHVEAEMEIRKLLLGELSPEEQSHLEERQFLEQEYFQQVQAAEDDLIDEYLCGDLTIDEREHFEKRFLSTPERRADLRAAKALQQYLSKNTAGSLAVAAASEPNATASSPNSFWSFLRARRPVWQFSLAAVALLIALGGIGIIVWSLLPKNQSAPSQARQDNAPPLPSPPSIEGGPNRNAVPQNQEVANHELRREDKPANTDFRETVEPPRSPAPPAVKRPKATVYTFLLIPVGIVRGEGGLKPVRLPDGESVAEFQLPLIEETKYKSYRVALQTDDKKTVRNWPELKSQRGKSGDVVSVRVPAKLLRQPRYSLILSGVADDGAVREISSYPFQVTK
jgi:hypothetical protein